MVSVSAVVKAARLGAVVAGVTLACASLGQAFAEQANGSGQAAAAQAPAAGSPENGREIFDNFACGTCHVLGDAGATGHVGPSLDGNANLTHAYVVDRVTNGQAGMPAYGGQLSEEEIADLAAYVVSAAAK